MQSSHCLSTVFRAGVAPRRACRVIAGGAWLAWSTPSMRPRDGPRAAPEGARNNKRYAEKLRRALSPSTLGVSRLAAPRRRGRAEGGRWAGAPRARTPHARRCCANSRLAASSKHRERLRQKRQEAFARMQAHGSRPASAAALLCAAGSSRFAKSRACCYYPCLPPAV